MDNVVAFPKIDPHFGGCPKCGGNDGIYYANIKSEWMVCNKHRVKWWIGRNLMSGWRIMDATDAARHEHLLAQYREVDPIHPAQDATYHAQQTEPNFGPPPF